MKRNLPAAEAIERWTIHDHVEEEPRQRVTTLKTYDQAQQLLLFRHRAPSALEQETNVVLEKKDRSSNAAVIRT